VSTPVVLAVGHRIADGHRDVVEEDLTLGERALTKLLERTTMGDPRQVEGNDDLHPVGVAFSIEEAVTVVGDDREDPHLRDGSVRNPSRALTIDDDVATTDPGSEVSLVARRSGGVPLGGIEHGAVRAAIGLARDPASKLAFGKSDQLLVAGELGFEVRERSSGQGHRQTDVSPPELLDDDGLHAREGVRSQVRFAGVETDARLSGDLHELPIGRARGDRLFGAELVDGDAGGAHDLPRELVDRLLDGSLVLVENLEARCFDVGQRWSDRRG
jgi:hypothetical protein